MSYAGGGIVRHLGLQNYKGAVPALSELIANAWDADASEVHVTIPVGKAWVESDKIIVEDNGSGMTWDDCNSKYLVIGRNRRIAEQTDRTTKGRPLMAHKGLGKLAGFGIAKIVEVKSITSKKKTHFSMSFEELDKLQQGETYKPNMIADEEEVDEPNSTQIILKSLTLQRAINEDQYKESMSTRFSIFSDRFKVFINDDLLEKKDLELDFRFPEEIDGDVKKIEDGYGMTTLANGVEVKWWIGFTEDTIKEEYNYGVSVIARGRLAQDPWDFNLAGGAWGQHGLRYMTGEIIADYVDEGISYDSDTILTNRSRLNWDHTQNIPLYDWARRKISALLRIWAKRRGQRNIERVQKQHPEITEKIELFQPRERTELNQAMRSLASIPTMQPERLARVFNYVIDGYQDKIFFDIVEELSELPPEDGFRVLEILEEFDIAEAIRVHKLVRSHVEVIRKFRDMIEAGVPEKPDMHDHIRKYPWLIGIKYQPMYFERSLKTILDDEFGIEAEGEQGRKIPDITVLRSGKDVVVVELKRPGKTVGLAELEQTKRYVDYLRDYFEDSNTEGLLGVNIGEDDVEGYLIAHDLVDDGLVRREQRRLERDKIQVCKWHDILMKTEDEHRVYLDVVKSRAPEDDPRIKEITI